MRCRRHMQGLPFALLLPALFWMLFQLTSLSDASDLFYSIQVGSFLRHELAQRQFDRIRETLPEDDLDHLRIEQYHTYHIVRIGRFAQKPAAEALLNKVRALAPEAYIVKVRLDDTLVLRSHGKAPLRERERTEERQPATPQQEKKVVVPRPEEKVARKPLPEPREGSSLKGTVVSTSVISPHVIGVSGEGKVHRVVIAIEQTQEVKGMLHLLRGREGETLPFFSEEGSAADLGGRKIEAKAVYLGEDRGRLFWLRDIKVIE